jgi:uncharacterized membrane protein YqaE (UPF0057 family)
VDGTVITLAKSQIGDLFYDFGIPLGRFFIACQACLKWRSTSPLAGRLGVERRVLSAFQPSHRGDRERNMRLLLAIFLPWLQFFTIGRPFAGVFCLLLQLTILGWIPAAIWSVYALSEYKTDKKIEKALAARK